MRLPWRQRIWREENKDANGDGGKHAAAGAAWLGRPHRHEQAVRRRGRADTAAGDPRGVGPRRHPAAWRAVPAKSAAAGAVCRRTVRRAAHRRGCLRWVRRRQDESTGGLDEVALDWLLEFQSLFMRIPDGSVVPGGITAKFMSSWSVSPINSNVEWQGQLKSAWLMVSPLLPPGSYCSSGYRSADAQKRIIDEMFLGKYAAELRSKLGTRYATITALTGDARYIAMVPELRAIKQAVALPGRSPHQKGKAFDIGGPDDAGQIKVCKMVSAANVTLFSGFILRERNGCVHVEIV